MQHFQKRLLQVETLRTLSIPGKQIGVVNTVLSTLQSKPYLKEMQHLLKQNHFFKPLKITEIWSKP